MAQVSIRERRNFDWKREREDLKSTVLAREAEHFIEIAMEKWNIPKDDIYFELAIDRLQAIYKI